MGVLVSALRDENSTSRGDISGQLNFSMRSLFTNKDQPPRMYLFVKCQEVQNSPCQSSETGTSNNKTPLNRFFITFHKKNKLKLNIKVQ